MLYLTSKGEHTVLYKINKNGYTKTSKIIIIVNNIVSLTYHTHMHIYIGAQKQCNEEWGRVKCNAGKKGQTKKEKELCKVT